MSETDHSNQPAPRGKYARSEGTRARILAAALEESVRVGFHKVSMANIAARAEVAVGILNYHFGSRQEMLHELMSSQVQNFWLHLSLPQDGLGFFEHQAVILRVYLEFLHANPNFVHLSEEIRLHEPELYRQGTYTHVANIVKRMESGIDRGELPAMSTDELCTRAYFIVGAYTFLDRLIEDDNYPGDEFVITIFMNTLRSGLAPDSNVLARPEQGEDQQDE